MFDIDSSNKSSNCTNSPLTIRSRRRGGTGRVPQVSLFATLPGSASDVAMVGPGERTVAGSCTCTGTSVDVAVVG